MAAVGKGVVQIQADHIENVYARAGVARAYQLSFSSRCGMIVFPWPG